MEKLIKLLNEFENTDNRENEYQVEFRESKIISKKFGFIGWLVRENKIDLEKLDEKAERKPQYTFIDDYGRLGFKLFEVYESVLMLLSISDNPISDLISYLQS